MDDLTVWFARFSLLFFDLILFIGFMFFSAIGFKRSIMKYDYDKDIKIQEIVDTISKRRFLSARLARSFAVIFFIGWGVFTMFLYIRFNMKSPFSN